MENTWTDAVTNQTFPVKTGHVIKLKCRGENEVLHGSKEITCLRGRSETQIAFVREIQHLTDKQKTEETNKETKKHTNKQT